MRELAAQFLALAEKQAATVPLMIGHRLMGIAILLTGDISEGRAHLDQAIALYDPSEHRSLATRFGADVAVSILSYRSIALWLLGHPEAALADTNLALKVAHELGQAASLMFALSHASLTNSLRGDDAVATTQSDELAALACEKGSVYWKAAGMPLQGCFFALTGNAADAVRMITAGLAALGATGASIFMPFLLSCLAQAYAKLGRFDEAWRCIDEAIMAVETTK